MVQEKCIRKGLRERFKIFDKLLAFKGIRFNDDDYVSVEFNYSRPVNAQELLDELNVQYGMGAISKKTIIEKSPITTDVSQEMDRLADESNNSGNDTDNHDKVNVNNTDKGIVN
jgi:hypothetical protein